MNKRYFILMRRMPSQSMLALCLTAVFFSGGCIIGASSAGMVLHLHGISDYLSDILSALSGNSNIGLSFFAILTDTAFYHLIAFSLSFLVMGFLIVPILVAIRGYIFAFSVSIIIRYYGSEGIMPAFLLFGLKSLIATPCFIFITVQAFCASMRLSSIAFSGTPNGIKPYDAGFVLRCGICFLILLILSTISYLSSDAVLSFILSTI